MKRIALIGLGPHARRIYYPYLEEMIEKDADAVLELVIDLEINRFKIEEFINSRKLKPTKVLFLKSENQLNPEFIHPSAANSLHSHQINKAIISTEPKAHKIYIRECINLGIDVLTDKPVTAPTDLVNSLESASKIYEDVSELIKLIDRNGNRSRVLVQCQRRNHEGYRNVFKNVELLVKEYNIPMTFLSIHHSDGMWNMPNEFIHRENHPYKYGYGKLMHSGYHFIDLMIGLFKVSKLADNKIPDSIDLFSQFSRVTDQLEVINEANYKSFFGNDVSKSFSKDMKHEKLVEFGEVDSFSQIQLTKNEKIITTAQLSLIQSGFSQRAWCDLPEDAYKSNGRIRHEYVNIHIGPLANIQVHSYQSKQVNEMPTSLYDVGDNNHFDIFIFRNSNLIGGQPFEKIQFGEEAINRGDSKMYLGHNEYARHETLNELMYDIPSKSELKSHLGTNFLLSEIYKNHARQTSGKIPFSKFKAKDIV